MLKKQLTAMIMTVTLGAGGVIYAQSGAMSKDQMDKGMMKNGSMTVTGCVAAGPESGKFMLNNAMMMGGMDKDKMAKDTMAKPGMSGHMMSYELVGGDNLAAHLGHKIEVMGTMSKSDMQKMMDMQKMDKDKMDQPMAGKDMKAMKLDVKSFKMLSAACS